MPSAAISQAGAGTTHIVSGIAGKVLRVKSIAGAIGTTGTVKFQSSGGTALTGVMNLVAGQPLSMPDAGAHNDGWFESLAGEGIDVVSATGAFNGVMSYQVV